LAVLTDIIGRQVWYPLAFDGVSCACEVPRQLVPVLCPEDRIGGCACDIVIEIRRESRTIAELDGMRVGRDIGAVVDPELVTEGRGSDPEALLIGWADQLLQLAKGRNPVAIGCTGIVEGNQTILGFTNIRITEPVLYPVPDTLERKDERRLTAPGCAGGPDIRPVKGNFAKTARNPENCSHDTTWNIEHNNGSVTYAAVVILDSSKIFNVINRTVSDKCFIT